MKGSLIILLFFVAGLLIGIFNFIPFGFLNSSISFYVLCALLFVVGISIGNDTTTVRKFKNLNPRFFFLPFFTILGTLIGVFIISLFLKNRSLTECLAVGSGFGYYSLSSILITQYKGAELGTIALLANIFREIFTLLFAPFMVNYFGKLAPIAAGGATTMDTTFPIIMRTSGKDFAIVAIYSGFVLDLSVPFLVSFFSSF